MKWWICLTALVLALTTSAAAADLPAELAVSYTHLTLPTNSRV